MNCDGLAGASRTDSPLGPPVTDRWVISFKMPYLAVLIALITIGIGLAAAGRRFGRARPPLPAILRASLGAAAFVWAVMLQQLAGLPQSAAENGAGAGQPWASQTVGLLAAGMIGAVLFIKAWRDSNAHPLRSAGAPLFVMLVTVVDFMGRALRLGQRPRRPGGRSHSRYQRSRRGSTGRRIGLCPLAQQTGAAKPRHRRPAPAPA